MKQKQIPVVGLEIAEGTVAGRAVPSPSPSGPPDRLVPVRLRGIPPRSVVVEWSDGTSSPLPHLDRHSDDGFGWGYSGDGPLDLARSLVGFIQGTDDPDPRVYRQVTNVVALWPGREEWTLGIIEARSVVNVAVFLVEDAEVTRPDSRSLSAEELQ